MSYYEFMPNLLNMSLTASVAIVFVILLRLLLKKAPKVISYALWGVVLIRLLCPVSIGSGFSLYNLFEAPTEKSGTVTSVIEYVPSDIVHTEYPSVNLPVPGISDVINEALPQGEEQLRADPLEGPLYIATYSWLTGVLAMVIYSIVSYVQLRRKLLVVVPLRDNIFIADDIKSPFVVGFFRPKIYLPCNLGEKEQEYIILHEQHHIKRLDHVIKALAFLALAIHWFNPLVWAAFILVSKDMEMSCDETVIRKTGGDVRADYSASLLALATGRRIIAGTPLAFGEGDTKGRINNLSKWKKPTVWVVLLAAVACIALAVGLLTNPAEDNGPDHTEDGYFLMIGADGVASIEVSGANTSGGVVHADGSVFKNGEKVWLEPLQGVTDLRGYSITALGKDGEIIYALSIPEGATNNEVINLVGSEEWLIAPTGFDSSLSGIAGKTYAYEGEGFMGSFTITLYNDGTFTYYEGMASSYIGVGSWKQEGDTVTLIDDGHGGYGLVNRFKLDGEDLVFVEQDSDNFVYVKVENGEKFRCTGEVFKNDSDISVSPKIEGDRQLTIEDVILLSEKGYDLTWSDFEEYYYYETGSGLYIRVYEIDELFELWIGGTWTEEAPMYIRLSLADDLDTCIDIRDGGVEEFVAKDHSETLLNSAIYDAILNCNLSEKTVGLNNCASFILLAQEKISGTPAVGSTDHTGLITVYGLALYQGFNLVDDEYRVEAGSHIPVAITFDVGNGKYRLKEYWTPRDGSYYVQDIRDKFPDEIEDEALDTQNYIRAQKQECYDQAVRHDGVDTYSAVEHLFEVIESSPAESSRPADYIDAHPIEYRELTYYGSYTLQYIFSKFLEGNQTGLRGHLMRIVLDDLAPEAQLRLYAETGQKYFDEWRAGALRISEQHDMDWIKENQPAIWLFLRMDGE